MSALAEEAFHPASPARQSPYQGIVPYSEADAEWFFGRDESREIVIDNLRAYRVSVFFGESGVGKTSVLRASVLPRLRAEAERTLAASGAPEAVAVVFAEWSVEDPLAALKEAIRREFAALSPELSADPPTGKLADVVVAWCERARGTLFLILDQFEEFFLYHAGEPAGRQFEEELTAAVRSREADMNILLGIREDALAKLDRLQARIPGLLDNLLRLEHLDREAACEAIEGPLERWYETEPGEAPIEDELVQAILTQVEALNMTGVAAGGGGRIPGTGGEAGIEAPYLQLVLTRIWEEERALDSKLMRLETLQRLGGSERIVRTHLDEVLRAFSRGDRAIAAKAFRFLVTPSGTKTALKPNDLAAYAGVRAQKLEPLLAALASEPRILRPVAGGAYEIYHDVLAAAILDWVHRYEERKSRGLYAQRILLMQAAVLALLVSVGYLINIENGWESRTVDVRFSIRGAQPRPKDVVVVGIDDDTFKDFGNRGPANHWPFSRLYQAHVINRLHKDGARVIAYDVQFTEPTTDRADLALIEAVRKAGNVVLATNEVNSHGKSNVLGGVPAQRFARAQVGDASYAVDPGATIRRMHYAPQGLTSFPVAAAEKFLDTKITPADMGGNSAWIDYVGPPGTIRGAGNSSSGNEISFSRVYLGMVPASVFRGKVVVVGPASPTLGDVQATSTTGNSLMSGAEVQANAIETALRGFPLRPAPDWVNVLLIVLLGMLPLLGMRLRTAYMLAIPAVAAVLFAVAIQFAFDNDRVLAFTYPLLALVLTTTLMLVRRARQAMSRPRGFAT
jgi:CHASE2 domain-containing sensor protein